MIFKYGTYTHGQGEVDLVSVSRRLSRSNRGYPESETKTMNIRGEIIITAAEIAAAGGSAQSAITTKVLALEAAYIDNAGDAALYNDDGTTVSGHVLNDASSMDGIHVVDFRWLPGRGEYATRRSYAATLEAVYDQSSAGDIVEYNEQLLFSGNCGPRTVLVETLAGDAVRQTVNDKTMTRVMQRGRIVVHGTYSAANSPLWATTYMLQDSAGVGYVSPQAVNGQYKYYTTTWDYQFAFNYAEAVTAGTVFTLRPTTV